MKKEKSSLSKGGVYYLIYQVLNMAFPLLTGIYVSRVLLPDAIGKVTAAQNLAQYFVIFAFLGIPTYGMREIAKVRDNPQEKNRVFSELYLINLVSTVFFSLVYFIVIISVEIYRRDFGLYLVAGISIVLNAFNISWLYEGLEEFRFISIRNLLFKILSFAALVIFVRNQEHYLLFAAVTVFGTAGNYLINMIYAPRYAHLEFRDLDLKRHLKPIFYLVAVNLAIEIYSLMDVTMMNFFSTEEAIAFYRYGHSIEAMLFQVINTFTIVLVPRISYYYKQRELLEYNRLISKAFKLIVLFSVPMIVGIYFTADFLIVALYGEAFIRSANILKLFSLELIISPIGYLLGSRVLLVTDHENKMLISVGIGAVVNLIGNWIMIPLWHETGATVASLISETIVMIVYVLLGRKFYSLIKVKGSMIKTLIAAGIMGGFLYVCEKLIPAGWGLLILHIAGGALIYFLFLLIIKEEVVQSYWGLVWNKLQGFVKR